MRFPAPFTHALGLIKHAAAQVNAARTDRSTAELDRLLDPRRMLAGGIARG